MRQVKLLVTTQIRLFPPDMIPLYKLILDQLREAIRSLFNFQTLEPIARQAGSVGVNFLSGAYGPNSVLIENVSIEERRIAVKVHGTTEDATAVYEKIRAKIEEFAGQKPISEILCTHETACSVVLDIPYERLFSHTFLSFIETSAKKYTRNAWSENYVTPGTLRFNVRYKVTDDTLIRNHVTLASKQLIVEPREQSAPEDRLYWVASPTDTDTHFKLIEEFEEALSH